MCQANGCGSELEPPRMDDWNRPPQKSSQKSTVGGVEPEEAQSIHRNTMVMEPTFEVLF